MSESSAPSWIQSEIQNFGARLQITGLRLNEKNSVALRLDNGRRFVLEYNDPRIFCYTLSDCGAENSDYLRLLTESHPRNRRREDFPCHTALWKGQGARLITLTESEISSMNIFKAMQQLLQLK